MENKISFTKQIKEEICANLDISDEKKNAILSAYVKNLGIFKIVNKTYILILKTDSARIAKFIYKLLHDLFNTTPKFAYETSTKFKKSIYYVLRIESKVDEILEALHIDMFDDEINEIYFSNTEYRYGYICGTFLACGSCNDPSSSNYHLEMSFGNPDVAVSTQKMVNEIKELTFNMRLIKRRNKIVLYLKKSDLISNFLVLIGAVDSCLAYEDKRIERDFSNIDNRMLNLDGANWKKTMDSARKQIEEINLIKERVGFDIFQNDKLKGLAELRLENEDASLATLAEMLSKKLETKVSKSNVVHLFAKISKLASYYRGDEKNE